MAGKMGEWAFLVGVLLALVFGIFGAGSMAGVLTLVLVVLGLIVGFLNVTEKETTAFLVAAAVLLLAGSANLTVIDGVVPMVGTWLQNMISNMAVFVAPAAIVVALKSIKNLAKD